MRKASFVRAGSGLHRQRPGHGNIVVVIDDPLDVIDQKRALVVVNTVSLNCWGRRYRRLRTMRLSLPGEALATRRGSNGLAIAPGLRCRLPSDGRANAGSPYSGRQPHARTPCIAAKY